MVKKVARNSYSINFNFYYKNLFKKTEEALIEVHESLKNKLIKNSLIREIIKV
jgi:hypothetical protein